MKATCVFVLIVSFAVTGLHAEPQEAVRAMDAQSVAACEHGRSASPSFRALVDAFDPERVVVHVVSGETRVFGTAGSTRLAGRAGAWRYLRITLDPDLPLDERTAVLGHELQHAREIVAASAATQGEVLKLYERIGRPVLGARNTFETLDAVSAGTRVWRELRTAPARRTTQTRIVVEH